MSSISSEELRVFINGPLSEFFSEDVWSTNWSNASSQSTKNIISPSQQLETSITANEPALRKVAMAYVMMCNLGAENMNAETYQTLAKSAAEILNEGFKLLNSSRTRIGVIQQTVKASNEALRKQSNMLEIQIGNLESVDQAEVATRTNNLLSRIEASLALTSRIASLTLVRYL